MKRADLDPYFNLPLDEKNQLVVSMRHWIMWDIFHGRWGGKERDETDVMIKNLIPRYGEELALKLVEYCQNSLPSEFLKQYGIDPTLLH